MKKVDLANASLVISSPPDPFDVDLAFLKTAVQQISKENFIVEIRKGLEIETLSDEPEIRLEGKTVDIEDVSEELRNEILDAAQEHRRAIKALADSKYTDPATNPMIRMKTEK